MRSYEAARTLFSFLGFCAWSVVVIGVLVALIGAGGGSRYGGAGAGLLAMVPGIGLSIAGLLLLAFVQMGRAGVDTAEYTQQMLKISRNQLEVSQQALKQSNQANKSFASVSKDSEAKKLEGFERSDFGNTPKVQQTMKRPQVSQVQSRRLEDGQSINHLGHQIRRIADGYVVGDETLCTLNLAERHIERNFTDLAINGIAIEVVQGKYGAGGKTFETIDDVKRSLEERPTPSTKPLPKAWNP